MEFHEKLQELRKSRGLTQEELAACLFVSRAAVSKWESGRGYPGLDSIKAIAQFFSVTVDFLLSSDAILVIAEEERRATSRRLLDTVYGLLDLCHALLLFLPFFVSREDGVIRAMSLLDLVGVQPYLKVIYMMLVIGSITAGILSLAIPSGAVKLWEKGKVGVSLALGVASVLLFAIGSHPYAAVFAFVLLLIKAYTLIKRL